MVLNRANFPIFRWFDVSAGLYFTSTIAELIAVEKDNAFIEGYMSSSKMIYRWRWRKSIIFLGFTLIHGARLEELSHKSCRKISAMRVSSHDKVRALTWHWRREPVSENECRGREQCKEMLQESL
ncbi:hypothetical protein HanRHA438_Chr03g0101461 [Helianthus annuus]|nr:hypothetical protein HanXRQr2_Chr13g0586751 [Helianthus annuus]KAF5812754.1 hypothetical protein HanXRQr2_Chr03g0090141 [Helianthus annuus]KAF5813385.1 hypothetical protein HanXRQr2_Chr03g0097701 [Helianthus annuus]KAJ0671105.1 hypothetical protein HanOQP8_Chr13g0481941 [Helianthus annuus]KAJ0849088.1 hypothetical protein HanPSC8_Chr13g0564921 [Helianthus annuus]